MRRRRSEKRRERKNVATCGAGLVVEGEEEGREEKEGGEVEEVVEVSSTMITTARLVGFSV